MCGLNNGSIRSLSSLNNWRIQALVADRTVQGLKVVTKQARFWPIYSVSRQGPHNLKQGPWDIAAPQLIVVEAGGVFLNSRGERVSPFTPEPMIISADPGLARWVIEKGNNQSHN